MHTDHSSKTAGQFCRQVSLVIPAHNEAAIIEQAIVEACNALNDLNAEFEVIVVDDGSTDRTSAIAKKAAERLSNVRVLTLPNNVGYAEALRTGFRWARYEWVAFTDADCQFDLHDLAKLFDLAASSDVVCGIRFDRQDPWLRKLYSKGFNALARTFLGTKVRDCDCALKLIRRNWVNSVGLTAKGFFFNAELLARASQGGLAISEVNVTHRPRQAGQSKVSVFQIFPILKALVTFWWAEVAFPQDAAGGVVEIRGKVNRTTHLAGLILGLIAAAVLLPNLSFPFLDPDETRYAEIAKGMFETGDYVVPMRADKAYLDKPPLLYWLTALSYSILGVNEFAARLPVALSGIATVLATYWYGRLLVGTRAAWIAGFLELTCIGFVLAARFVFTDGLLTLFTTAGLLSLFAAVRNGQFRLGLWATGALCCGLGVLTKGPIAVALCLPPLLAHSWLSGRSAMIKSQHWCLFGLIVAATSLPWFIGVWLREPAFMMEFLFTHHLSRFVSGLSHDEPMWFYIPILLVGMLPCSILLPAAVAVLVRKGAMNRFMRTPEIGYLILAALWVVGLFSASSCKLPPYILPAIPPLCIIVGTALSTLINQSTMSPFVTYVRRFSPRDVIAILTTTPMILGVVDTALFGGESTDRIPYYGLLTAIGASLLVLASRGVFKSGPSRWIAAGFYAIALNAFGATNFTGVVASNRFKVPPIVNICGVDLRETTSIVCFSLAHESDAVAFYFPDRNVHAFQVTEATQAIRQLNRQEKSVLLAHRESLLTLQKQLPYSMRLVEIGRHEHIVAATVEAASPAQQAFHLDISDATE